MREFIIYDSDRKLTNRERNDIVNKIHNGIKPRNAYNIHIYSSSDDSMSLERLQEEFKRV